MVIEDDFDADLWLWRMILVLLNVGIDETKFNHEMSAIMVIFDRWISYPNLMPA